MQAVVLGQHDGTALAQHGATVQGQAQLDIDLQHTIADIALNTIVALDDEQTATLNRHIKIATDHHQFTKHQIDTIVLHPHQISTIITITFHNNNLNLLQIGTETENVDVDQIINAHRERAHGTTNNDHYNITKTIHRSTSDRTKQHLNKFLINNQHLDINLIVTLTLHQTNQLLNQVDIEILQQTPN